MTAVKPPRAAQGMLTRTLPSDVRDVVLGDLEELFQARVASVGAGAASRWYWGQAMAFTLRFSAEGARERLVALRSAALPSWLDVKLGARMLVKSPLLTVTGCVAIATAIAINAGFSEFMRDLYGVIGTAAADDRMVGLVHHDQETADREARVLHDLPRWREGIESVEQIGAAIRLEMSLTGQDGRTVPIDASEMSASGFLLNGATPLLGRTLSSIDDGPQADPVVVLSEGAWRRYFDADPDIVGRAVRMGGTMFEVAGVVPADFRFPSAVEAWVNFRRDPEAYPPRSGPPLVVFGGLAEGRSLEEAQAEVERFGALLAADRPETHARLRPELVGISELSPFPPQFRWILWIARSVMVMLLVVASANVATLVFARNVGRTSEIAVRSALGAGRGRIVTQLFAEAMVLALVSAAVGLFVADQALRYGGRVFWEAQRVEPPIWWEPGMSLTTIVYSLGLAALGAGVVGVLPALRATGSGLAQTLRRAGSGGSSLAFGRLPTFVIVTQIAIAVAMFPLVLTTGVQDFQRQTAAPAFPIDRYLTARILVDSEVQMAAALEDLAGGATGRSVVVTGVTDNFVVGPTLTERYAEMRDDVADRVRQEAGVRSVTLTTRLPGIVGESYPAVSLEVDGQPEREQGWYARSTTADPSFFDVVGRTMALGRAFTPVDYGAGERVAVVNQAFVRDVLGGEAPVGRRVRPFAPGGDPSRPWTEIVGVLADEAAGPEGSSAQIYYPMPVTGEYPVRLLIEVDGDPNALASRLRTIVAEAESGVILDEVIPLGDLRRNEVVQSMFWFSILGFVALVTLLLATAGVYALMSFIVSQRTREIGIRTALGAEPSRVVRGVFARTFTQLGLGAVVGLTLAGLVGPGTFGSDDGRMFVLAGLAVTVVVVAVGFLGCLVPLRRALRIHPTQALRAEG